MPDTARFQVFPGKSEDEWYVRLRARNGEPVAISEAYTTKYDAQRGVIAIATAAMSAFAALGADGEDDLRVIAESVEVVEE